MPYGLMDPAVMQAMNPGGVQGPPGPVGPPPGPPQQFMGPQGPQGPMGPMMPPQGTPGTVWSNLFGTPGPSPLFMAGLAGLGAAARNESWGPAMARAMAQGTASERAKAGNAIAQQQLLMQQQKFAADQELLAREAGERKRFGNWAQTDAGKAAIAELGPGAAAMGPDAIKDLMVQRAGQATPAALQGYQLAVEQGYQGSLMDYEQEKANYRPAASTTVNVQAPVAAQPNRIVTDAQKQTLGLPLEGAYIWDKNGEPKLVAQSKTATQGQTAQQFGNIANASLDSAVESGKAFDQVSVWSNPVQKAEAYDALKSELTGAAIATAGALNLKGEPANELINQVRATLPGLLKIIAKGGRSVEPALRGWRKQVNALVDAAAKKYGVNHGGAAGPSPQAQQLRELFGK